MSSSMTDSAQPAGRSAEDQRGVSFKDREGGPEPCTLKAALRSLTGSFQRERERENMKGEENNGLESGTSGSRQAEPLTQTSLPGSATFKKIYTLSFRIGS